MNIAFSTLLALIAIAFGGGVVFAAVAYIWMNRHEAARVVEMENFIREYDARKP